MILFDKFCTSLSWLFIAGSTLGSLYQLLAAYAVRRFAAQKPLEPSARPPVTLLKPLCGDESDLYHNLRSFCELDYPDLQIVCGVREATDPAIGVVRQLQADMPHVDLVLVSNPALYGTNYKVSNLINMMQVAKHDILVMSDSDMLVDGGYLDAVVGTLQRPGAGLATCLYTGKPTPGIWSEVGAAGINFWFLPSATVSKLLGGKNGCYGATIAIRRQTLERVGGFPALKDQLADDYALGALIEHGGDKVIVVPYFPATIVDEPSFRALFRHEMRWARTIRNMAPSGYAGSAITHPLPLALLAAALGSVAGLPSWMLITVPVIAVICRVTLVAYVSSLLAAPKPRWWILLARDVLSLVILVLAYFGRSVSWRNSAFRVDSVGALSEETDGI